MVSSPVSALLASVLMGCVVQSFAASFLSAQTKFRPINTAEVEKVMAEFIGASSESLARVERDLSVMYAALPKNVHGNLDPATSSYALHRYFVQKYGWSMAGLEPVQTSNASQQATVMQDRAPAMIQSMLERRVEGKGMGLREVAIFASVLTDLIVKEVAGSFLDIWSSMGLPTSGAVSAEWAEKAVKMYMMYYIMEEEMNGKLYSMDHVEAHVKDIFPGWDETVMWVTDFRATRTWMHSRESFNKPVHTFETTAAFTSDVTHHFSSYQKLGCSSLKNDLMEIEHKGSGRVLMSRFYVGALKGDWAFGESQTYLRHLGVLDETDPDTPSVVISNYINSKTNCLVSTGFYSLCCADECEGLMQHVEAKVRSPRADPAVIADVVAHLSSDTVDAPRNLSSVLLQRLNEVADMNGGTVPIHGRMFAQWMHHVYPRECMQPEVERRVTSTMSGKEWLDKHGDDSLEASAEQLQFHVDKLEEQADTDMFIPWIVREELIEDSSGTPASLSWSLVSFRTIAAFMAIASFGAALVRMLKTEEGKAESVMV